MADRVQGTMEDVGATYPVCLACGEIGTSGTRDGDPCPKCDEEATR